MARNCVELVSLKVFLSGKKFTFDEFLMPTPQTLFFFSIHFFRCFSNVAFIIEMEIIFLRALCVLFFVVELSLASLAIV